MLKKVN